MRKSAQRNTNEDNNIFEVEEIINKKIVNGINYYFIKWQNYAETENTWEPEQNLNCNELIIQFEKKLKQQEDEIKYNLQQTLKKGQAIEEELEKIQNRNQKLDKRGHFNFGDKLSRILKDKVNSKGIIMLEIVWQQRQNGQVPENSYIFGDDLKEHCPKEFIF